MLGLEVIEDPLVRQPAPVRTTRVLELARDRGLLLLRAGTYDNVVRLLVPLVASEEELGRGLDIMTGALEDALGAVA